MMRGRWLLDAGSAVGWDQRRFAAPTHHDSSTFRDGGPALEANLSHPPEELTYRSPVAPPTGLQ